MPREKEDYRPHLESIRKDFPDRELLTQREVADYLGISYKVLKRRYGIDRKGVTRTRLARLIS